MCSYSFWVPCQTSGHPFFLPKSTRLENQMDDLTYALVGLPVPQLDEIHYQALMKFNTLVDSAPGSLDHAWAGIWASLIYAADSAKGIKNHAAS